MRFDQLEYIISLQETGTISRTAEKYLISHQAVSKAIKALETELSVVLFERSVNGVIFTPAGKRFCIFAKTVLAEKNSLERDILPYQVKKQFSITAHLNIYALSRFITSPFLDFIDKIQFRYPHLDFILREATVEYILEKINFDDNTLVLIATGYNKYMNPISELLQNFLQEKHLLYQVISDQPIYACVHKKSNLASEASLSLEKLEQYQHISFNYAFDSNFKRLCHNK